MIDLERDGADSLSERDSLKSTVTIALSTVLGLLALCVGLAVFWPTVRTWAYHPVDGVIVESALKDCGMEVGGYSSHVRFSYSVEGSSYSGTKLRHAFGVMCEPKEAAQKTLDRYPIGAKVQVWHDLKQPQVAVVDRSLGMIQWGFLIVLSGLILIFLFAKWTRRPNTLRAQQLEERRLKWKQKINSSKEMPS